MTHPVHIIQISGFLDILIISILQISNGNKIGIIKNQHLPITAHLGIISEQSSSLVGWITPTINRIRSHLNKVTIIYVTSKTFVI